MWSPCCPNPIFFATQASVQTLAGPLFQTHMNAIESKNNCIFTMCMTSFSFCLAPISPLYLASYKQIWLRLGSLPVWVGVVGKLLPRSLASASIRDRKAKGTMFSFHKGKSVTQGFLMPTKKH